MTRGAGKRSGSDERLLAGFHAVIAAVERGSRSVEHILIARGRSDPRTHRLELLARQHGVPVRRVEAEVLDHRAGDGHQGVAAVVSAAAYADAGEILETLPKDPTVLVLDGIQDPQNLGAILRVAAAAGVAAVFLPEHGSCGLTAAVAKASAGAIEIVPVAQIGNLAAFLDRLKGLGFWIFGAAAAGDDYAEADLSGRVALVVGGEGEGLRRLTRERCDRLVGIPMASGMESLNAATATAVLLFEIVRQKRFSNITKSS